ncbi:ribosomal protein S18 acetylase RimI-like enzyme [Salibacterium salarium]|uniref:GNAT family N-acetyltransferase n=1 Tax=Salibacterium salarium TaxID=284579 RepID=UPI002786F47D|nr:GNAT family N-acetyltransferase [Salibacterium salarium]MDQ0300133.1 ribosomal protein S18 acetylase RimI-like enzyme [Salibacterium salarium]
MGDIETRRLTVEDAEECAELRKEALLVSQEHFAVTYEEEVVEGDFIAVVQQRLLWRNSVTIGGFYNGALVGTAMLLRKPLQKMQHKADIEGMYVAEEFREKGIGKSIMNAILAQAKIWEVEQLHLSVVKNNTAAKSFYQSVGFQPYGIEKAALKYRGMYWDEEFMVLFLKE